MVVNTKVPGLMENNMVMEYILYQMGNREEDIGKTGKELNGLIES